MSWVGGWLYFATFGNEGKRNPEKIIESHFEIAEMLYEQDWEVNLRPVAWEAYLCAKPDFVQKRRNDTGNSMGVVKSKVIVFHSLKNTIKSKTENLLAEEHEKIFKDFQLKEALEKEGYETAQHLATY